MIATNDTWILAVDRQIVAAQAWLERLKKVRDRLKRMHKHSQNADGAPDGRNGVVGLPPWAVPHDLRFWDALVPNQSAGGPLPPSGGG